LTDTPKTQRSGIRRKTRTKSAPTYAGHWRKIPKNTKDATQRKHMLCYEASRKLVCYGGASALKMAALDSQPKLKCSNKNLPIISSI